MAKIYHYTSIETLALILKYKTIRFNRLDQVDDYEEACYGSGDLNLHLGQYCFVSCWTREDKENLSLWKMYTDYKGVRIGIDEDMFVTYHAWGIKTYFDTEFYRIGKNCVAISFQNEVKLYDVNYVDNPESEMYKLVEVINGNMVSTQTAQIGLYKKKEWECQNESRFKIVVLPFDEKMKVDSNVTGFESLLILLNSMRLSMLKEVSVNVTNIDIPLNVNKIKEMEVMCGPQTTEGEKEIIKKLLQDYPTIEIKDSYFDGKIRKK